MQFVHPVQEQYSVTMSSNISFLKTPPPTDVTADDVRQMIVYLRKARDRAIEIRDRSPAGSYMENVLCRTIDGITLELSQLDYLLARKPIDTAKSLPETRRMRPAI